jgi:hypothetical protein
LRVVIINQYNYPLFLTQVTQAQLNYSWPRAISIQVT